MRKINISNELYTRALEFKCLVEEVIEEKMENDNFFYTIIHMGIDSMLQDLIGSVDSDVLVKSFKQLGERYPKQVYGFIIDAIK